MGDKEFPKYMHLVCGWPLVMIAFGGAIGGGLGGLAHRDDPAVAGGVPFGIPAFGFRCGAVLIFRVVDAAVQHAAQGVGKAFLDDGKFLNGERAIVELAILEFVSHEVLDEGADFGRAGFFE